MKRFRTERAGFPGASLIEALIAMGVLAVVLPLVFAVLARSGQSCASARAETRCAWIIPACMAEIEAAHRSAARFLPPLPPGQPIAPPGGVLVLAFAGDGRALGRVARDAYLSGVSRLAGEPVRYLASLHSEPVPALPNMPPLMNLRVTLEFPSASPQAKRQCLDFHSRIP